MTFSKQEKITKKKKREREKIGWVNEMWRVVHKSNMGLLGFQKIKKKKNPSRCLEKFSYERSILNKKEPQKSQSHYFRE